MIFGAQIRRPDVGENGLADEGPKRRGRSTGEYREQVLEQSRFFTVRITSQLIKINERTQLMR